MRAVWAGAYFAAVAELIIVEVGSCVRCHKYLGRRSLHHGCEFLGEGLRILLYVMGGSQALCRFFFRKGAVVKNLMALSKELTEFAEQLIGSKGTEGCA